VVRVPVGTIETEAHDDLRAHIAHLGHDTTHDLLRRRGVEPTVAVAEHLDTADSKLMSRRAKLLFTNTADLIVRRAIAVVEVAPTLAACSRDEKRLQTLRGIMGEGAAESERLVIGMCEDGEETKRVVHGHNMAVVRPREKGDAGGK
jgi:hypothetical protein